MKGNNFGVVLVTASSEKEAQKIAISLIEDKLAACVNVTKVNSFYTWENKINSEVEWQLIIKTDLDKFEALAEKIEKLHSYEVPEIIALPIVKGSQTYFNWIKENINH